MHLLLRSSIALFAILAMASAPAHGGPDEKLVGMRKTARLEIRYRPGSRAAADVDRTAVVAEQDLDRIGKALDVDVKGPFRLWLYDDVDELSTITATKGNGGFSSGDSSHVPFDNDQTRLHELVHVVAAKWPAAGKEPRNLFHAEGLANAVLGFVHGVHVHAVAAFERRAKRLPTLGEMTDAADFYAWIAAHPKLDAYDIAGSWYRFLLDRFGAAKSRAYYGGATAKEAMGSDLSTLERAWHATLDAYALVPEVETLLRMRRGEPVSFDSARGVPAAILGSPSDWTSLATATIHASPSADWTRSDGKFMASHAAPTWSTCELGDETYGDCVFRATVHTANPLPIELRLGAENRVLLVQSIFLYRDETPLGSAPDVAMTAERKVTDFVVARRGDVIDVWIDDVKVLTAKGSATRAKPGLGVHLGSAVFENVRIRRLR